jgi:hypothetical protein
MFSSLFKKHLLLLFSASLFTGTILQASHAAVIDTQAAIELDDRADRIAHINTMLARHDVRGALVDLGVSPNDATARVQRMTDAELQLLEQQLNELPAGGGLIGVVGIVAIILVILELLDVTDLFTAF